MKHKSAPAAYALPDSDEGAGFTALVSVFNNVDLQGDIVRPGAFADSIEAYKSSGNPIPVLWSHRMDDPHYNIGSVADIAELAPGDARIPEHASEHVKANGGLWVKADLDTDGVAGQVRKLLSKRRVTQFSFAYDVLEEKALDSGVTELRRLALWEVGPTPLGANPLTVLDSAKSHAAPPAPPRAPASLLRLRADLFLAQLTAPE